MLDQVRTADAALGFTARLPRIEELNDLLVGAVWAGICARRDVPMGLDLIGELERYQADVAVRG